MKKKNTLIMWFVLISVYLLIVFISVDYNLFEFKLSIKALLRQELTLEEMKNSNIYKAYDQINHNTNIEEINSILNKESKNIVGTIESWYYPYGYVSIWYSENGKPRVYIKTVDFKTPYTRKISEEELYAVFECDSLEKIISILGEPAIQSKTYNRDGDITEYNYEWGIKTKYSRKFIQDMEKHHDKYVSLPWNDERRIGKFRLAILMRADKKIESFSLAYYEERRI
ncbi:MAG: hypothetical protein ACOYVK_07900 [Bacillota bacterium]